MKFYSTINGKMHLVGLEEAILTGSPLEGGQYQPYHLPKMPASFFQELGHLTFSEIVFALITALFHEDIPTEELKKMANYPFEPVLKQLHEKLYILELFHGPTLSFKDFGAYFMARLVGYLSQKRDQTLHVLVATTGDTGGAIGNGFYGIPNTKVWILYPQGKISSVQEKQITTIGDNVNAIEVNGTFDDCQEIVKTALKDEILRKDMLLTSANSINVARLLPQIFHYFSAISQLYNFSDQSIPPIFSIPSGNFGNLTAGLYAKKMGLQIQHLIAATNNNDAVPVYLKTKIYQPKSTIHTLSSAMDVGNPNNFIRILDLYDHSHVALTRDIFGESFSDPETITAILECLKKYHYLMDPHGAVSYLGWKRYQLENKSEEVGILFETAHPAKFAETLEPIIGKTIENPDQLLELFSKAKNKHCISNNYEEFKGMLYENSFQN